MFAFCRSLSLSSVFVGTAATTIRQSSRGSPTLRTTYERTPTTKTRFRNEYTTGPPLTQPPPLQCVCLVQGFCRPKRVGLFDDDVVLIKRNSLVFLTIAGSSRFARTVLPTLWSYNALLFTLTLFFGGMQGYGRGLRGLLGL